MRQTRSRWRPPPTPTALGVLLPPAADTASLTRLQRVLLATDGTVTHILETYADEPVAVVKLLQAFDAATADDGELGVARGERVLRRRVVLRGRHTWRNLLYAEAVVVVDRVNRAFLDALVETDKPLGVLVAENRMETFREILRLNWEAAGPCAAHFGLDPEADVISRTYRIVAAQEPVVLVTEKFPPAFFRALPP